MVVLVEKVVVDLVGGAGTKGPSSSCRFGLDVSRISETTSCAVCDVCAVDNGKAVEHARGLSVIVLLYRGWGDRQYDTRGLRRRVVSLVGLVSIAPWCGTFVVGDCEPQPRGAAEWDPGRRVVQFVDSMLCCRRHLHRWLGDGGTLERQRLGAGGRSRCRYRCRRWRVSPVRTCRCASRSANCRPHHRRRVDIDRTLERLSPHRGCEPKSRRVRRTQCGVVPDDD